MNVRVQLTWLQRAPPGQEYGKQEHALPGKSCAWRLSLCVGGRGGGGSVCCVLCGKTSKDHGNRVPLRVAPGTLQME